MPSHVPIYCLPIPSMATFASLLGWAKLASGIYIKQGTLMHMHMYNQTVWSDCAVFSSVYKARHYTDCVAKLAEESMHGVVNTVKALLFNLHVHIPERELPEGPHECKIMLRPP